MRKQRSARAALTAQDRPRLRRWSAGRDLCDIRLGSARSWGGVSDVRIELADGLLLDPLRESPRFRISEWYASAMATVGCLTAGGLELSVVRGAVAEGRPNRGRW